MGLGGDEVEFQSVPWGSKNSARHGMGGISAGSGVQRRVTGLFGHGRWAWENGFCDLTGTSAHPSMT